MEVLQTSSPKFADWLLLPYQRSSYLVFEYKAKNIIPYSFFGNFRIRILRCTNIPEVKQKTTSPADSPHYLITLSATWLNAKNVSESRSKMGNSHNRQSEKENRGVNHAMYSLQ